MSPADWRRRSETARALAERYDWSRATRMFEQCLRQVAGCPDAASGEPASLGDPAPDPAAASASAAPPADPVGAR